MHYIAVAMDEILKTLGRAVRSRRERGGMTRAALSQAAGISVRFLLDVEKGDANLSVLRLQALARALDAPIEDFLGPRGQPAMVRRIALLGIRGAGKTTIGRRLASRLGLEFVELDQLIEERSSLSLSEIFTVHGEEYYRRLERSALESVLAGEKGCVIATGGGIVTSPETFRLLKARALTIWLRASARDHWNRVLQQGDNRPLTGHPQAMTELRRLLSARRRLYSEARHTLDTSALTPDQVTDRIVARIDGAHHP